MSESCATSGRSRVLFHTGLLTCAGSRYFRQLQEISDSVGDAPWDDVDAELALQKNGDVQIQLERKIVTGRARQRYVRYLTLYPKALTYESSSPICPKSKSFVKANRTRVASCVNASSFMDTSHNGTVRSSIHAGSSMLTSRGSQRPCSL